MMQMLFAFTFNTDTQEGSFSGNVEPMLALQVLQGLVLADAINKAVEAQSGGEGPIPRVPEQLEPE